MRGLLPSRRFRPGIGARAEPVAQPLVGDVVFLGDGQRVGQAVGGLPDHPVGALGRVAGSTVLIRLTTCSPRPASSSTKVT